MQNTKSHVPEGAELDLGHFGNNCLHLFVAGSDGDGARNAPHDVIVLAPFVVADAKVQGKLSLAKVSQE